MNVPCSGLTHRGICRIKPCKVTEEASRQCVHQSVFNQTCRLDKQHLCLELRMF